MLVAPSTSVPSISPRTSFSAYSSGPAWGLTKFEVPHWFSSRSASTPCPLPEAFVQSPDPNTWSVSTQNVFTARWPAVSPGSRVLLTLITKRSPGASTASAGKAKVRLLAALWLTVMPDEGIPGASVLSYASAEPSYRSDGPISSTSSFTVMNEVPVLVTCSVHGYGSPGCTSLVPPASTSLRTSIRGVPVESWIVMSVSATAAGRPSCSATTSTWLVTSPGNTAPARSVTV